MAIDLVSLVSQALSPQLVGQIAKMAGVDPAAAQKLVGAAAPAILAALGGAAATPGGAQKLSDAISNADPDLLKNLASAAASGQGQLFSQGASALGGILGAGGLASLANALGQHAGVPAGAAQTAIGAVSQAIIGVVGQQDPSNWSDGASIASLLSGQKSAIAAALPSGLASALNASGLLAGLGGMGAAAAATASSAASAASSAASRATSAAGSAMTSAPMAAARSSGFPMWAIILIVIIVLAAIYWFMRSTPAEKPAMAPATIEWALAADASVNI